MRRQFGVLGLALLVGLGLGCDMLPGASQDGDPSSASASADDDAPSFVGGLVDKARELLPTSDGPSDESLAASNSAVARSGGDANAIVRCEVKGKVTFTRAAHCDNAGGYGQRMALKGKVANSSEP